MAKKPVPERSLLSEPLPLVTSDGWPESGSPGARPPRSHSSSRLSGFARIAGGLAHEINNPVAIIHGKAGQLKELARQGKLDNETVLQAAEKIETTALRIANVVQALRALVREASPEERSQQDSTLERLERAPPRPSCSGTVLVVDDEPDLRDILVAELKSKGYQTLQAASGKEALELVTQYRVDAVITDMRMPNGTGIELLDWIKRTRPTLPVILVTGFSDISEAEAVERGAAAVLTKPFERHLLLEVLGRSLEASDSLRKEKE